MDNMDGLEAKSIRNWWK